VIDVRYNTGGHIATFILDVLARPRLMYGGFRDRAQSDPYHMSGNRALNRPTVLVTNQASASNAEIFTELYRRMGLGNVVGTPTSGQVIGTIGVGLLNGSHVRLPMYYYATPEGENLEGIGRTVDVNVDRVPGEWAMGRDQQLDAAVRVLLDTLPEQREEDMS
jgi:C-terminal processing protease CtpA/Prc